MKNRWIGSVNIFLILISGVYVGVLYDRGYLWVGTGDYWASNLSQANGFCLRQLPSFIWRDIHNLVFSLYASINKAGPLLPGRLGWTVG